MNYNFAAVAKAFEECEKHNLKAEERILLIAISRNYNDEKRASWPSVESLKQMTGLGRTTISKYLVALEHKGLILREKEKSEGKQYTHNVYRLPGYVPEVRAAGRPKTTKPGTFGSGSPYVSPPGQVQEAGFFT